MPRFEPHPQRRPAVIAGASSGIGAATAVALASAGQRALLVRPGPTATGMGMSWDAQTVQVVLDDWSRWGLARHRYLLRPCDVAAAVTAVVSTPRGVHLTMVEIQPEAPLADGARP